MKRFYLKTIFLFVVVFSFSQPAGAQQQANYPRLIIMTGDAQVKVVPDEVILKLGVETWDRVLTVSQTKNDEIVKKAFGIAKEFKIEDKNIQTDYIKINPTYDSNYKASQYERGNITGYLVQKTIAITLKDVTKFESLLTRLLEGGVNYVHGVQFSTSELRKYRDQARSLALKAAREKANDLAQELGVKLGKPYNVSSYSGGRWADYGSGWSGGYGGQGMSQNIVEQANSADDFEGNSVALGQFKVSANVSVSFEIE